MKSMKSRKTSSTSSRWKILSAFLVVMACMGQLGQLLLVMRRVPLPENEYSINLQHNVTKPFAIVDYFMYNGEPIVSAHLETLNETVDFFYITESTLTFSGKKKDKLFKDIHADIFIPYEDKIRWNIYTPIISSKDPWEAWNREKEIRGDVVNKLRDDVNTGLLPMDFVILNTDADEIMRPKVVQELRPGGIWHEDVMRHALKLDMKNFVFNYNWYRDQWTLANVISGQDAFQDKDKLHTNRWNDGLLVIPNAGYHLSWGLSVEGIILKLESFSHQENNKPEIKERGHIIRSITNEENLFYQKWKLAHYDYKKLPLPLQTVHEAICKVQNVSPVTGKSI